MSLPSQDVLDDISELISEVTGFQESDENFKICQRYCLSHVVHHTYPFVNRNSVKNLINSYVSRFYGHGYFKVSQELNHQVKSFLSNENLFEKNPQYDIQWCLLSLVCSLSSNLSTVSSIPELLPIDNEENETEIINWAEYLTEGLPKQYYEEEEDNNNDIQSTEEESEEKEENYEKTNKLDINTNKQNLCQEVNVIKTIPCVDENAIEYENKLRSELRKDMVQELLDGRAYAASIVNDFQLRGNIAEKFDELMSKEGVSRKSQYLSEYELMECILYQFQTGEKILLRKGLKKPALLSLTQETLGNYLESLQPYFKIIRCFKDFIAEIMSLKYPIELDSKSGKTLKNSQISVKDQKPKISNILYIYSVMLEKALEPFENKILEIADKLPNMTLIQMQKQVQSYFFELVSLSYTHGLATKNWKNNCNWICSIRILTVLYQAITNATTVKMSFLYLNIFLNCFQVYLDIIDSWISFLNINDPNDEFIVTKSDNKTESGFEVCCEFQVRPYKEEMESVGVRDFPVVDFIANKMTHVGQSLEVLRRLGRYVTEKSTPQVSSYEKLIESVNAKIVALGNVKVCARPPAKAQEKKRSIFTMRNINVLLGRDNGGGDSSEVRSILEELSLMEEKKPEEQEKKKQQQQQEKNVNEPKQCGNHCLTFIQSTVSNQFFRIAFENVGLEYEMKRLEERKKKEAADETGGLMIIKEVPEQKLVIYPYHKIISESCYQIIGSRVYDACALVKNIVLDECALDAHLSLLKNILLFNESHLIRPLIISFFTQPMIWKSSYSLNLQLKECLEEYYSEFASSFSVSVGQARLMECQNVLQAIDNVRINYEVKWPLSLIFTKEMISKYNEIFRVALKLKWAHWSLSNLHFQEESKNKSRLLKQTHHRLQLLRFWFLSSLGRINNYFMAQMNPSNLNWNTCDNLKEIINAHATLIDKIYYDCLLSDKAPELSTLIFQTLIPLCVDLSGYWTEGGVIPNTKLTSLETNFGNCQLQLSLLMSSLEKK